MGNMDNNSKLYTQKLSYRSNGAPQQFLAQPWFIRSPGPVYYPHHACQLEPLICGEDVFLRLSRDLEAAQHSVDIITWGFDPGMVLVRGASAEVGIRYGDLLKKIATRENNPVMVRLLVWHDDAAAQSKMNNVPGYYGRRRPFLGSSETGYYSDAHHQYSAAWFDEICSNAIPTIQFHVRDMSHLTMFMVLAGEPLPDGLSISGVVAAMYPTHHQKMVLIDYERPAQAVGYVMEHNSTTEFWDRKQHVFQDPKRERIYCKCESEIRQAAQGSMPSHKDIAFGYRLSAQGKRDHEKMVETYMDNNSHIAKPYQDVSCRVQGSVLHDLNDNFCKAWKKSELPGNIFFDMWKSHPGLRLLTPGVNIPRNFSHVETDPNFMDRRVALKRSAFDLPNGQHGVQLVRTQPQYGEKDAKECYANLTRQMRHYMFIQNQYIQYVAWADHLMHCMGNLRQSGYHKPLYIFMLTSTPERDGMDAPTYEVASKVGMSEAMKVEHETAMEQVRRGKGEQPITAEKLQKQGINVFMGSLWTCADIEGKLRPEDYEEIYIHAKVAVVDDAAFTIGSTNLNLRSMALDSELNILSDAKDVAFKLRSDLFSQCSGLAGAAQFGDMKDTFEKSQALASQNKILKKFGIQLTGQLLPFYVDRKPGSPVI